MTLIPTLRIYAGLALVLVPTLALAEPPVILDPQDGAVVPENFPVTVEVGDYQYCDTEGCYTRYFEDLDLRDGDHNTVERTNLHKEPPDGQIVMDVTMEPGTYNLYVRGQGALGQLDESEPISITVEGEARGCSVNKDAQRSLPLLLATLLLLRRRRSRTKRARS